MLEAILSVKGLEVTFSQYQKGLHRTELKVISNLDIDLYPGKILAVVGASGSGKSLLAHAVLDILPDNAKVGGAFVYRGENLSKKQRAVLRGKDIALIPQSVNYLDPLMKVGKQVKLSDASHSDTYKSIFKQYGLAEEVLDYYPHQLSGGMARKVLLATALVSKAKIIIADEPTPGLDEQSVEEVLKDFTRLAEQGCSVLMITHDIQAALKIADQIAIFYAGSTIEVANVKDFNQGLRHPYTKALFAALPTQQFESISGTQPLPNEVERGCLFYGRCTQSNEHCKDHAPENRLLREGKVRCHHAT